MNPSTKPAHAEGELCYLGLGGNLGQPLTHFQTVLQWFADNPMASGLRLSPVYESTPIDATGPNYINAALELRWALSAEDLLAACMQLEQKLGRQRLGHNAPRTIDLDVLMFGQHVIQNEVLTVPHPRMHQRRFVLQPLHDLNPMLSIPGLGPISSWLAASLHQEIHPLAD